MLTCAVVKPGMVLLLVFFEVVVKVILNLEAALTKVKQQLRSRVRQRQELIPLIEV